MFSIEEHEEELFNAVLSALAGFEKKTQLITEDLSTNLIFEGMIIDVAKREVYCHNKEVKVTFIEFEILCLLAKNPGRVFSKEQIYDIVWKEPYVGDYNIVTTHIRNIREKIEADPSRPVYVQTVWGVGYCFNKNLSSGL